MRYQFTPAAERVFQAAAGWASCDDLDALQLPEILLGLLDEPECRAAQMLAEFSVDPLAVQNRWNLRTSSGPAERVGRFSVPLKRSLREAESRLWDYPQPITLATEHLLLGILADENDVAKWLQDLGMDADSLEERIHRFAGHERRPLELPDTVGAPAVENPFSNPSTMGDVVDLDTNVDLSDEMSVLRVLDAAANRASEGLRVIEDYVRFAMDDRHLTRQLKTLRHELAQVLSVLDTHDRLAARESISDVGADVKTTSEFERLDAAAVLTASFQRLQQSLRSLEEFSKLQDPAAAGQLEKLRYRAYTLQRAICITHTSLERLQSTTLCVLLDGRGSETEFCSVAESLMSAGVPMVQLRDKILDDRSLLNRARALRQIISRGKGSLFIMNDRPDLAVLADADGVHVGQQELSVKDARRIVGSKRLIGVSTHTIEQARQAVLDGADYIGVGPTFPSTTKVFQEFPGLELMRAVSAEIRLPAFSIGGINLENINQVIAVGGRRVAVAAAVCNAADVRQAAGDFLACLSSSNC